MERYNRGIINEKAQLIYHENQGHYSIELSISSVSIKEFKGVLFKENKSVGNCTLS